jgi:hypothetical protein
MPVTVLIPLIVACMNAAPVVVKDIMAVVADIKASKATTVQPAHVAALKAVLVQHGVDTTDIDDANATWAADHAGE